MTKSRNFTKEYALELLRIATEDLEAANVLMAAKLRRKENIFFHIEQAIEKALKAVLCKHGIAVPLVHELSILIDKIPEGLSLPHAEEITDLTQFATIRRYEEGKAEFTDEEVVSAFQIAGDVLKWANKA